MKIIYGFLIVLLCSSLAHAGKTKTIEKHFPTKASQTIELRNFLGSQVKIKSWDKNEVYINLKIRVSSSDEEWEEKYIKSVNVSEDNSGLSLILTLDEPNVKSGSSFLGIKINLFHYEKKEFFGEIFVPTENAFTSDLRYGAIFLSDMKGEINLTGTSNEVEAINCASVNRIENNYGTTKINNCGGSLVLKGMSSTIKVNNFKGSVNINADYSNIDAGEIKGALTINSISGTHVIHDIYGDLKIKSNYSTMQLTNVDGFVDVRSISANITIKKAYGAYVDANYSTISIFSVDGKSNKECGIEGMSGAIKVEDLNGNLRIKSPYSEISLKNIKGNVNLSGNSSKVRADNITGNWDSKTNYTDFYIGYLDAKEVRMENMSGIIDADFKSVPHLIDIQNKFGNVKIKLPGGYSGEIELTAKFGEIFTDFPLKKKDFGSSNYNTGKIGNGSGSIVIETQSSNIELKQK